MMVETALRSMLVKYPHVTLRGALNCLDRGWDEPPPGESSDLNMKVHWVKNNCPSVADFLKEDKKIHAIKELRVATGWNLLIAKNTVEKFAKVYAIPHSAFGTTETTPTGAAYSWQSAPVSHPYLFALWIEENVPTAIPHLKNGSKIGAIKDVRTASASGLKEAKEAVEVLAYIRKVQYEVYGTGALSKYTFPDHLMTHIPDGVV